MANRYEMSVGKVKKSIVDNQLTPFLLRHARTGATLDFFPSIVVYQLAKKRMYNLQLILKWQIKWQIV